MVAARNIVAAAGPRGLFTGYLPTLLEDIPDMAFKFAAYESLRAARLRLMRGRKATVQVRLNSAPRAETSSLAAMLHVVRQALQLCTTCDATHLRSCICRARL